MEKFLSSNTLTIFVFECAPFGPTFVLIFQPVLSLTLKDIRLDLSYLIIGLLLGIILPYCELLQLNVRRHPFSRLLAICLMRLFSLLSEFSIRETKFQEKVISSR